MNTFVIASNTNIETSTVTKLQCNEDFRTKFQQTEQEIEQKTAFDNDSRFTFLSSGVSIKKHPDWLGGNWSRIV